MANTHQTTAAILRRPQVERRTGLKRSSLYGLIKKNRFPKPVPLGARSVGWLSHEVDEWIGARIAERDEA